MPHCIIEHSPNISPDGLMHAVFNGALHSQLFLLIASTRQNFGDHVNKRCFAIANFEILVSNGPDFDIGTIGQE